MVPNEQETFLRETPAPHRVEQDPQGPSTHAGTATTKSSTIITIGMVNVAPTPQAWRQASRTSCNSVPWKIEVLSFLVVTLTYVMPPCSTLGAWRATRSPAQPNKPQTVVSARSSAGACASSITRILSSSSALPIQVSSSLCNRREAVPITST